MVLILGTISGGAAAQVAQPAVTLTRPADAEANVKRDAFVSADVSAPNGGIDAATLTSQTVYLYRNGDGQLVPSVLNTSGGGDVIVLRPISQLDADTAYTFVVTSGLQDVSGVAFAPFSMSFTCGAGTGGIDASVAFEKVTLSTPTGKALTCVTIGPDGMLYASVRNGEILRFPIHPDGTLGAAESLMSLRSANGGDRLLIGLRFDPASTAENLVLWASHSFYAFSSAPDWTGKITRLSGPQLETVTDVVIHLPRSTRDHVTNQIDFGPDGALYFAQGSCTAMGAPDSAWGLRPEHLLNAAVLRLDPAAVTAPLDAKTEQGGVFDPYAPGSPLTIYASGVRNSYDLLWHSNGSLYVPTNGSASGGATPASPNPVHCTNRIDEGIHGDYDGPVVPGIGTVNQTENDWLFRIKPGGYYGHPNPSRCEWVMNGGNPTSGADVAEVTQYPVGTQPDRNWRGAAFDFGQHQSPNGIIESRSGAFGGALLGKILIVRFSGGDDVIVLTPGIDGEIVRSQTGFSGMSGFNNPLDLVEDPSNGFIYVTEYGDQATTAGAQLTLLRPIPGPCTGAAPSSIPELRASRVGTGTARLTWSAVATATGYDVVRGSVEVLRSSEGDFSLATNACAGNELVSTSREDPTVVDAGSGFFYLVRAVNCASTGTYDSGAPSQQGTRDAEIQASPAACP